MAARWRDELTRRWERAWPSADPAGHLLRSVHRERWLRVHTLPGAERYAGTPREHAETARRQRALLDHLVDGDCTAPVLVVTSWAWRRPEPPARMPLRRQFTVPGTVATGPVGRAPRRDGRWWRSMDDPVTDEGTWTHLYAARRTAGHASIAEIFRLVADDQIAGVLVMEPGLGWVLAPYDGGVDVFTADPTALDQLRARFGAWASGRADGL